MLVVTLSPPTVDQQINNRKIGSEYGLGATILCRLDHIFNQISDSCYLNSSWSGCLATLYNTIIQTEFKKVIQAGTNITILNVLYQAKTGYNQVLNTLIWHWLIDLTNSYIFSMYNQISDIRSKPYSVFISSPHWKMFQCLMSRSHSGINLSESSVLMDSDQPPHACQSSDGLGQVKQFLPHM